MATADQQQVAFDVAPPNSVLTFRIREKKGFVVIAKLDQDTNTVATFGNDEIVGKVVPETLVPKALYTLEIKATLTSKSATDIHVEVGLKPPGKPLQTQVMTFVAKKRGDVCMALAFVLIK